MAKALRDVGVFDWGEASVAHPFGVFLVLRFQLARAAGVSKYGPELTRLQEAYLECFSDMAPQSWRSTCEWRSTSPGWGASAAGVGRC